MAAGVGVFIFRGCRHHKLVQLGIWGQQTEVMDLVHPWRRNQRRQSGDQFVAAEKDHPGPVGPGGLEFECEVTVRGFVQRTLGEGRA